MISSYCLASQALFPGAKQRVALLHCRTEVLAYLVEHMASTPVLLGDPRYVEPSHILNGSWCRVHVMLVVRLPVVEKKM